MLKQRCLTFAVLALLFATASFALATDPVDVLIVDGQNNHKWADTSPVLQEMLEECDRFGTVDVATSPAKGEDMSGFRPTFADYGVVVMNYTGDSWPDSTKADFEAYVAGGGGLVIYHAADNAFPQWEAFNEMIAIGGWGGRNENSGPYLYWKDGETVRDTSPGRGGSHGPQNPYQVVTREPEHPIMKGLPPVTMHPADELYSQLRGPAKNVTILATAFADPTKNGSGRNEPVLMVIDYGEGRVFHTVLGHHVIQIQAVNFRATFLRGCEWAATGEVTLPCPEDYPGPDEPVIRE
jgi:uncharacterized protein